MNMPESQTSDAKASEDVSPISPETGETEMSVPVTPMTQEAGDFSIGSDADRLEAGETADAVSEEVVAQLAEKTETLQMQLDERTNQYMRLAADFENFRRRTEKEKEDLEQQVKRKTLGELLPVVDSFDLARSQIKPQTDAEISIHKSYQGVYKQLVDCLKRIGVAPMRSEGKPFDPNMHEAVLRQPTGEHPEGTVLEELKRGYLLGDRVLRHAMVKVAATPEADTTAEDNPE